MRRLRASTSNSAIATLSRSVCRRFWRCYVTAEETERLALRVPRLADAPELLDFFGDREVMRYTYHLADLRGCRRHIAGHGCQRRKLGFGPWTIIEKTSGQIVGFGGLSDDPFDPGWGIE